MMTVSILTEDENGNMVEVPMNPLPRTNDGLASDDLADLQFMLSQREGQVELATESTDNNCQCP